MFDILFSFAIYFVLLSPTIISILFYQFNMLPVCNVKDFTIIRSTKLNNPHTVYYVVHAIYKHDDHGLFSSQCKAGMVDPAI